MGEKFLMANKKEVKMVGPIQVHIIKWSPPSPGFVKLNFDGYDTSGVRATAFVLKFRRGFL